MARRLREARNVVQHGASTVGGGSLEAHLGDAAKVLHAVLMAGFGVALDSLSVTSLVREPDLRAALDKAWELSAAGDTDDALPCAVAAFESLRIRLSRLVRSALGDSDVADRYGPIQFSHEVIQVFGPEHAHTHEPASDDWQDIVPVSLGVSLRDQVLLRRAKNRCDDVREARENNLDLPIPVPTADQVRAVVEAVARNVWRLESTQPELFWPAENEFEAWPR